MLTDRNLWRLVLPAAVAGLLSLGCNQSGPPPADAAAEAAKAAHVLTAEPAGAKGVADVRKAAKDGDDVVVVGRIGGAKQPWIEGRAAFSIVEPSFKSCSDREDDNCDTPWDYCCDSLETLREGMATVKVVDAQGATVAVDARKLGLRELQTVVVRGKAKRDEHGNLTVLASGLFVRP
jgi:hypothetical protein